MEVVFPAVVLYGPSDCIVEITSGRLVGSEMEMDWDEATVDAGAGDIRGGGVILWSGCGVTLSGGGVACEGCGVVLCAGGGGVTLICGEGVC